VKKIDHIAIAVENLDEVEAAYKEILNLTWHGREEVPTQKVMTSVFDIGESRLELVQPTSEESPIAGFLRKKGGGLHHICFEVDDIEAEMKRLKEKGARLLNDIPIAGIEGSRVAFLHPKSCGGVLVEIVER